MGGIYPGGGYCGLYHLIVRDITTVSGLAHFTSEAVAVGALETEAVTMGTGSGETFTAPSLRSEDFE